MKLNFDELIKQKTICLGGWGLVDTDTEVDDTDDEETNIDPLIKVIERSTDLETLDLQNNKLTLADGKLAKAIAKNNTIKVLDLSENKISDEGAKHLADALKKNNTLEEINLSLNIIGDEGVEYVAEMMADNETLQTIDLSNNNIGDQGAEDLVEALMSNYHIENLFLNDNHDTSYHMEETITAILNYPKREEIALLKQSIAKKDEELEDKDVEIKLLKKESAKKDRDLAKKDKQITSLKAAVRGQLQQPVDLTNEDNNEPANKRARTEDTPKSALAIQHEQNQQYSQRLVQVKQEKNTAEANLNEAREELEDAEEDMGRQVLFTDFLQSKIDELAALAEAGGADRARVAEIKSRSYSRMRS